MLSNSELDQDPLEVFELLEKMGEGSYGIVQKAVHKRTQKLCAIKLIPIESGLDETKKEIAITQGFASPYVVQFYGSYVKDEVFQ